MHGMLALLYCSTMACSAWYFPGQHISIVVPVRQPLMSLWQSRGQVPSSCMYSDIPTACLTQGKTCDLSITGKFICQAGCKIHYCVACPHFSCAYCCNVHSQVGSGAGSQRVWHRWYSSVAQSIIRCLCVPVAQDRSASWSDPPAWQSTRPASSCPAVWSAFPPWQ